MGKVSKKATKAGKAGPGAAQELKGHLTLERVTASRSGEEIAVHFSADMLVEERPFLALQRALRRNFAPTST